MVNLFRAKVRARRRSGMLTTDIIVAMSIMTLTIIPMAFSFMNEQHKARQLYQKAVAMELLDGEMEILAAGEWHAFKQGAQAYPLKGAAAQNLPKGEAKLTIAGNHLRLEWVPEKKLKENIIVREANGK